MQEIRTNSFVHPYPNQTLYLIIKRLGMNTRLSLLKDSMMGRSFYKQGSFTDLCRGPHLPNTGLVKAIALTSIAGAYWRGNVDSKQLTRIYGISFPKQKMLEEYHTQVEEAKKRDHRKLGKEMGIYMIDKMVGSGLPLWLPKGTILRRTLEAFLRDEQIKRGYQEVITPHIGNIELYKTSGHYPYYKDSQFDPIEVDEEQYMLKPMNCPHHHRILTPLCVPTESYPLDSLNLARYIDMNNLVS